jgi:fumarylacetoacetate (FAA) hydrolase
MVFSGKVYETDGASAIAVHEAEDVRPLAPVPHPPSLRVILSDLQPLPTPDSHEPHFFYGNPSSLVGPSQVVSYPVGGRAAVLPLVAAVIVSSGYQVELELADDTILGLTLLSLVWQPGVQASERALGGGFGRSIDSGAVLGPVVTTPDELDDFLIDQEFGRRYGLNAVTRVNGVERTRGNLERLPWSFAQAISGVSRTCTVKEGDIIAMGPLTDELEPIWVEPGDEIHLAVENLGTLGLKMSEET